MPNSETRWIERALTGSQDAYRHLLGQYQRPVFSVIVRMVHDAALAEDLTQETFVKAFRALESFDRNRKFSSWLFSIAHNTTIDHLRRKQVPTVSLEPPESDSERPSLAFLAVAADPSPQERLEHSELARVLELAMATLRPEYAEVLTLRFQESLSYEEISDVTGLALGTVKTHLYRARKALAEALGRAGWDPGAYAGNRR